MWKIKRYYFIAYKGSIKYESVIGCSIIRLFNGALPNTKALNEATDLIKNTNKGIENVVIINYKRLLFYNWYKNANA